MGFAMELARWRLAKKHFTRATTLGTTYDAHAAEMAGYLDELVLPDELEARALDLASGLAGIATAPLIASKRFERADVLDKCRRGLADDVALFSTGPGRI